MTISALDFSVKIAGPNGAYPFGTGAAETAAALRSIADKVESGEVALQTARVMGLASAEDYAVTSVRLVFVEKKQ